MSFGKGFASGSVAVIASLGASSYIMRQRKERTAGRYAKYGLPSPLVTPRLDYPNHALCYDPSRKIPLWVAERLTASTVTDCAECSSLAVAVGTEPVSRKKARFQPDPAIPKALSAQNADYFRSGWSRGHMAPAGDNKHSQDAMNATFLLSNILPQDIKNNGGYWNLIELYARRLTENVPEVYVISGPLFRPAQEGAKKILRVELIGKSEVAAPTHLYKVIVAERPGKPPLVGAFVVPNARVPLDQPLKESRVKVEELGRQLGLNLLPKLPKGRYEDLCDSEIGCDLMPARDFRRIIYERRLSDARKLHWLEKQWQKVVKDGLDDDPALRALYEEKKAALGDNDKGSTKVQLEPKEPQPVAAASG